MRPVADPASLPERMRADPPVAALVHLARDEPGLWLVGGAVRDLLLGRPPLDLDVVTEGDALGAARRIAERLGGEVVQTGRFDTASVLSPTVSFDLVRARRERYAHPGALPDVVPAALGDDLVRRDFTLNALAAALDAPVLGELRAPPGALDDLRAGRLSVFHPRSFQDDPTRLLRLARLAARLGLGPEPETDRLAREAVVNDALATVSGKRVGTELRLVAREPRPVEALEAMEALGLIAALHPGLELDAAVLERALALRPGDPNVVVASLARGLERHDLRSWLDRLSFEARDREAIVAAALDAPALAHRLAQARRPSQIADAARPAPEAAVALAGALGAGEQAGRWLDELQYVRLQISGGDVVAAGVPEGPAVGRALAAALRAKLDGEARGREDELRAALAGAEAG